MRGVSVAVMAFSTSFQLHADTAFCQLRPAFSLVSDRLGGQVEQKDVWEHLTRSKL